MLKKTFKEQHALEILLVVISLAITYLLYHTTGYKMVVLNLFYLPVILSGFFLGRYRAGILAFLCVVSASAITAFDISNFASYTSPIVVALAFMIWGAVLGLIALLVGTLSDERVAKTKELHEAYVGVVEVLTRYLQSANPRLKARSIRVAELSQHIAVRLKFMPKEIDIIRVAALLFDLGNIEITSRVIEKAIGNLETEQEGSLQHTFDGTDLVQSLGSVLSDALPLLLNQAVSFDNDPLADELSQDSRILRGAQILRTARSYDALREGAWGQPGTSHETAVDELRRDIEARYDPTVLDALDLAAAEIGRFQLDESPALA